MLIVKYCENEGQNKASRVGVEKAIMDNKIPVSKSFKNKSGDLVIVHKSEDKRNGLKELVSSANSDIIIDTKAKVSKYLHSWSSRRNYRHARSSKWIH